MSEFDKWFKAEMPNSHKKVNKERIETVIYSCAEAAWGYQQAKIDLLEVQLKGAEERAKLALDHKNRMVDELQARVDEAMKYVSESPLKDVSRRAMINFMDILKGRNND